MNRIETASPSKPEIAVERWMNRFFKDAPAVQLPKRFASMSAGGKAQELYDIMTFVKMAGAETRDSEDVQLLRSRASTLAHDPETRAAFAKGFARGHGEIKDTGKSPLYRNIAYTQKPQVCENSCG
jgi:hypothetical protein